MDTIDAVNAVKEENQDKDEGDLHAVLDFGNDGVFGEEARRNRVSE